MKNFEFHIDLTIWLFYSVWLFFRHGLAFFLKRCLATLPLTSGVIMSSWSVNRAMTFLMNIF